MTDNLPAVPDNRPATVDTDSWVTVLAPVMQLAAHVADTEFVPRALRGNAPAVAAAMLYGREAGLSPMSALNLTHVIEGRPALSAEAKRGLVLAAGHDIEVMETTGAQCIVRGRRLGSEKWTVIVWNMDMARAAGVSGKQVWQRFPRRMLQARATGELCDLVFADVTHGFATVESLEDMGDDGEAVEVSEAAPVARTRVARKRAAPAATPAPAALSERPVEMPKGPPLPGEEGYTDPGGNTGTPGGVPDREGDDAGATVVTLPIDHSISVNTDPGEGGSVPVAPPSPATNVPASGDDTEGGGELDLGEGDPNPPPNVQGVGPVTPGGRKRSTAQHRGIMAMLVKLGIDVENRPARLGVVSLLLGREVESQNDISAAEATALIDTLARFLPENKGADMPGFTAFLETLPEPS